MAVIDNQSYITLPEGVALAITPAGLAARASAYLLDLLLRGALFALAGLVLAWLGEAGIGLLLLVFFVVSWGYYIFFEGCYGRSPGKRRLKMRVVMDDGLPLTWRGAVLRNLLRPADMFPVGYALGMICMLCNRQFKRLGDWAAGTQVVYERQMDPATAQSILPTSAKRESLGGHTQVDSELTSPQGGYPDYQPSIRLTTEEQRLIINFAARSQTLSQARQQELAAILAPIWVPQAQCSEGGAEGENSQAPDEDEEVDVALQRLHRAAHYYSGQTS